MSTIALGNFDGVHIAHKVVLLTAARQGDSICLLFRKHPLEVMTGKPPQKLLSVQDTKEKILACGIKRVEYLDFESVKDLTPQAFFGTVLLARFKADCICCGYNYTFGKDRAGTAKTLEALCEKAGVRLIVAPKTEYEGEAVSSSRIRHCIAAGELEAANAMLGYPFFFEATVVQGKKLGRKLGFPTINQYLPAEIVHPRAGVYLSNVTVDGKVYRGLTNIGNNPTVGGEQFRSETYLFGFDGELYGKTAKTELLRFIREERKFESIEALRAQVLEDMERAKNV